jgi:heat shock protein HslJ
MQTVFRRAFLLGLMFVAACSTQSRQSQASLSGSSWSLVAYRAVSGAETLPERDDQYQLHFHPDGRLSAQIDCNRGSGSWQTTDQQAGLRLGPLALTKMMCPPAALTMQLPAAIETIQSYRILEGQLQLQAAGDAGSYLWRRTP